MTRAELASNTCSLFSLLVIRQSNLLFIPDLSIKPAWPPQSRVNSIWSVCRSNDNKLATGFQTIKKSKKLGYYSVLFLITTASSLWTQSIKFINE